MEIYIHINLLNAFLSKFLPSLKTSLLLHGFGVGQTNTINPEGQSDRMRLPCQDMEEVVEIYPKNHWTLL